MICYYNEIDPTASQWMRNLAAAGHISQGQFDERSIAEVSADDVRNATRAHFFSGIGGWDHALNLAGWPADRPVWTGSCPCQPFSSAGKREGEKDSRDLWPEFFRLITGCRPPVVFGEQVASSDVVGKVGRKLGSDGPRVWLDRIRADLEEAGYTFGACVLGAHSAGAPHLRQRLYWVAYAESRGGENECVSDRSAGQHVGVVAGAGGGTGGRNRPARSIPDAGINTSEAWVGGMAHTGNTGRERRARVGGSGWGTAERSEAVGDVGHHLGSCILGDTEVQRLAQRTADLGRGDERIRSGGSGGGPADVRGAVGMEYAMRDGWGQGGLPAANGVQPDGEGAATERGDGGPFGFWGRYDLIPCRDGKARRVEPGTFPLAYGVPGRVAQLRGFGNAIVPQTAAAFIKAFLETERS